MACRESRVFLLTKGGPVNEPSWESLPGTGLGGP